MDEEKEIFTGDPEYKKWTLEELREEKTVSSTEKRKRKDGSLIGVSLTISPIKDSD